MICEVNPSPGFVMGELGYKVEDSFLDGLFPRGGDGRIPIVAVLGDHSALTVIARLEEIACSRGHSTFIATSHILRCAGQVIGNGPFRQGRSLSAALHNRLATTAIVQLAQQGTLEEGLVFDHCDLAIVSHHLLPEHASRLADAVNGVDPAVTLLSQHSRQRIRLGDTNAIEAAARELFEPVF